MCCCIMRHPHLLRSLAPPSCRLVYFNGKGLAEVSRLMFAATGTAFTDTRFPIAKTASGEWLRPEFTAAQTAGEFPMMQVPVLKLADGAKLAQSKAIERYLAKQLKLAGASDVEAAHVDAVGELLADVRGKFAAAKDDAAKDAASIEFTRALSILEKLATTGVTASAGHIVGSSRACASHARRLRPGVGARGAGLASCPPLARLLATASSCCPPHTTATLARSHARRHSDLRVCHVLPRRARAQGPCTDRDRCRAHCQGHCRRGGGHPRRRGVGGGPRRAQ